MGGGWAGAGATVRADGRVGRWAEGGTVLGPTRSGKQPRPVGQEETERRPSPVSPPPPPPPPTRPRRRPPRRPSWQRARRVASRDSAQREKVASYRRRPRSSTRQQWLRAERGLFSGDRKQCREGLQEPNWRGPLRDVIRDAIYFPRSPE